MMSQFFTNVITSRGRWFMDNVSRIRMISSTGSGNELGDSILWIFMGDISEKVKITVDGMSSFVGK